jgi:hypothetical protein
MEVLLATAKRQASWSTTANRLKSTLDRVRRTTFLLSIVGAALATIASQLPEGGGRRTFAAIGTLVLALATFLTARLGAANNVSGWVRARAAAEALKREGYKFAAQAAPYDDPATAEERLAKERQAIEDQLIDLTDQLVELDEPGSMPTDPIAPGDYVTRRIKGQLAYYRPKAEQARAAAQRLRAAEFGFALLATLVTAAVGLMEKYPVSGFPFDLAALTAILTTIGATILSHIEASRYDFVVRSYRTTARRLEDMLGSLKATPAAPSAEWSAFVEGCEGILATENNSWSAKWNGK